MNRVRRRLATRGGFTIAETLIAATVLLVAAIGSLQALDVGRRANHAAERHDIAGGMAERDLEEISTLPYDEIALTEMPGTSADDDSPLSRVSGDVFQTATGSSEPLVSDASAGAIEPGPTEVSVGSLTAEVYRFVTWVDAPPPATCTTECDTTDDYKRITVAVRVPGGALGGFSGYSELTTLASDAG